MNCPDPNPNDSVFVTFKFASLTKGLKLSYDFKKQVKNFTSQQILEQLKKSPFLNSYGRMSISHRGRLNAGAVSTYLQAFPSINAPSLLKNLSQNKVIYYFTNRAKLEAFLPISGAHLSSIIPEIGSRYVIALTYHLGEKNSPPLGPQTNQYYGRYYDLTFDSGHDRKHLTKVEEHSLETEEKVKNWNCPSRLRFVILRNTEHLTDYFRRYVDYFEQENLEREAVCIKNTRVTSSHSNQVLESLFPRNTFYVGYMHTWETSTELKNQRIPCLAPQSSSHQCYDPSTIRVEWDEDNCNPLDRHNICPAYLSVCLKP